MTGCDVRRGSRDVIVFVVMHYLDSQVVRDVEFLRWDDDDEDEFPIGWSTAATDRNARRRFLCNACETKDEAAVREMLTSGWDVNETFRLKRETFTSFGSIILHDNFRALHQAARDSWLEGVDILLEAGADIDSFDYRDSRDHGFSHTALMHAANNGDESLLRYLLARGCNVNAQDPLTHNSALLLAAASCNIPCVQLLIAEGADVNVVGHNNETIPSTPLLAAVYYYRLPQWHHLSHEWNCTEGRERSRVQALTLMCMLIESGCDVDAHGSDPPPLHNSATCKDPRALELLLKAGACVNAVTALEDRQCCSVALAEAAMANNLSGVRLLIQHGADLHQIDRVCRDNNGDVEQLLLIRLLNQKYYDIAATLVYAGWQVGLEERDKMAAVCVTVNSSAGEVATADSESEDEDEAAALDAKLLNMSERSQKKRLKLEALRWALNFLSAPRDLRWSCRLAIRASMRSCSPDYVQVLPLPVPLLKYIMCYDL